VAPPFTGNQVSVGRNAIRKCIKEKQNTKTLIKKKGEDLTLARGGKVTHSMSVKGN